MKFKSIVIIFNITLLLFLGILILLPSLILGSSYAGAFWQMGWYVVLILGLIFCAFNIIYFLNRKLLMLLEKEDWPALIHYLEEKVIQKGKYSSRFVRLLANTYLVLSDSASVTSLENRVAAIKPVLLDENVLIFGIARIFGKDFLGASRFFETRKGTVKPAQKDWVCWYYGFSLLLNHQYKEAGEEFSLLAGMSNDAVVSGLSSYFLSETLAPLSGDNEPELRQTAVLGRERVLKIIRGVNKWKHEVSRLSTEIHAVAISKYMEDTGRWLFSINQEQIANDES